MFHGPDNLVLQHLRSIDTKVDRVADHPQDPRVRMTAVGDGLAAVNRRINRAESRLNRIELRLDLVDAPH